MIFAKKKNRVIITIQEQKKKKEKKRTNLYRQSEYVQVDEYKQILNN